MFDEIKKVDQRGVPLYVQIRENLREKIKNKDLAVGEFLPAETELADMFKVSRMTVRNAVEDLVTDGLLIRKQGTGTIVASTRVVRDYTRLTGFFEDAKSRGLNPRSKMIKIELIPAAEEFCQKLLLPPNAMVFHIQRLRLVEDDKIIALHDLHIPQAICPWIQDADLTNQSLYALYEQNNIQVEWGSQIVEARSATHEQAKLLEIEPGTPVLHSERISYTKNNLPIEHVIATSPGDLFSMNFIMRR